MPHAVACRDHVSVDIRRSTDPTKNIGSSHVRYDMKCLFPVLLSPLLLRQIIHLARSRSVEYLPGTVFCQKTDSTVTYDMQTRMKNDPFANNRVRGVFFSPEP